MDDEPTDPAEPASEPVLRLVKADSSDGVRTHRHGRGLDELRGIATVKRKLTDVATAVTNHSTKPGWLGGLLLYGPQGCGKTFSAEVLAGEIGAPLHVFDITAGWDRKTFGETVKEFTVPTGTDAVALHFENVDAPAAPSLLAPVLPWLDDQATRMPLVITASATFPWLAGSQLIRPQRLEQVLLVLPPDPPSRTEFLRERLVERASITDDDLVWLVERTEGHSFSDLDRLLEVALRPIRDQATPPVLTRESLRNARRDVGPSSAQWLTTAGHHALMNEDGGMYDDLLLYFHMRQRRT